MEAFLARLDEPKRTAFVLSEVEGWSAPEIARVAGTNANTVYSRIRLAKKQLRNHLDRTNAEFSPRECVNDMRAKTTAPVGAADRCWLAIAPQLAKVPAAAVPPLLGAGLAKLKLMALGTLLGAAGVIGLDQALPEAAPHKQQPEAVGAKAERFADASTSRRVAPLDSSPTELNHKR